MKKTRSHAEMTAIVEEFLSAHKHGIITVTDYNDPGYRDTIPAEAIWMFKNDYAGHEYMPIYYRDNGEITVILA